MMLGNIDTFSCLDFIQWWKAVFKKSSTGHASVLHADISITLKKILGTWRIPTCNESSASKKSSLPVIIQLINQFVFYDFSEEIENAQW